jgi:hypothetical protein
MDTGKTFIGCITNHSKTNQGLMKKEIRVTKRIRVKKLRQC